MGLFKKYKGSQAPAIRLQDSEEEDRIFKKPGKSEAPRSTQSGWKRIIRPKLRRADDSVDEYDVSQDLQELIVHKENVDENPIRRNKKATPLKRTNSKKVVKQKAFQRLSTADSCSYHEYEPPRGFLTRTNSHDKSHGSSRTFDIQSDEASFPTAPIASAPSVSGFSVKSDQSSTEFRQFVFDKNFQKIEKVAVDMSDPGTSDFSDFVAAAASLSRLMSPVMETDSLPTHSASKKERGRAFPIPRIKKTKPTEFVPLSDGNEDGTSSLHLFPSLTAESLSRANEQNLPRSINNTKDDASAVSNASGAHATVISSPRQEFLARHPFPSTKEDTKDLDPFHFDTQSEIDQAWFSATDPFKVHIDNIAIGDNEDTKQSGQHIAARKESTPVKITSSMDDSLIQSIKKANEKRDSDGFSQHHKPDPSPRGVSQSASDGLLQFPHQNHDHLVHSLGSNSSSHSKSRIKSSPALAGPQRKGPPKGVPSNAILGSMLFRQTLSAEAGSSSQHSRKKHKSTEQQSGWNEFHPEVAPPTHIVADDKAESTISSVTEEASSFYQKNFQGGWAKQAYNVLEQYHRNRRGNPPNHHHHTKRRRDPKEDPVADGAAWLERVDEENMFM